MAVRICCMYMMDNCYDGLSRCSEGLLNVPTWRCNLNALEGEYEGQSDVGRGVDQRHYIAQDERARVYKKKSRLIYSWPLVAGF
jgi:hypothetical protein